MELLSVVMKLSHRTSKLRRNVSKLILIICGVAYHRCEVVLCKYNCFSKSNYWITNHCSCKISLLVIKLSNVVIKLPTVVLNIVSSSRTKLLHTV